MNAHGSCRVSVLAIALAGSVTACGNVADQDRGPRDVLLVTVDTLRADHLGLYGYSRDTSPNIDRWFGRQIVYRRAYSTEAATAPSVASILTGLLPQQHRVRLFYQLLPQDVPTIADRLHDAGYQTAAVVSNIVLTDEAIGLGSHFDSYDDFVDERESARAVWERSARRTTDAALRWLHEDRDSTRPHFLWVHYIDPHGPYSPPPDAPVDFSHDGSIPVDPRKMLAYQVDPQVADALEYVDRYDEEIAYCDREIGRLLDAYRDLGLADGAVMALAADHGETMIEREWWFTHQYHVHEPIVHVPLAIRLPEGTSREVKEPVSLVDLAPTLLDAAGVAIDDATRARSLLRAAAAKPIFIEATSFDGLGQRRAMILGERKWEVQLSRPEGVLQARWLHRLDRDPGETQRLPWSAEDEVLAAPLLKLIAADPDPGGAPALPAQGQQIQAPKVRPGVGAKDLEALRKLGYVR